MGEHAVNVADDEIPPGFVLREPGDNPLGTKLGSGQGGREVAELHGLPNRSSPAFVQPGRS